MTLPEVTPTTAAFVVKALRNGSTVTVTWSAGALDGDPPTIDLVEIEAEMIAASRGDRHLGFAAGGDPPVAAAAAPFRTRSAPSP